MSFVPVLLENKLLFYVYTSLDSVFSENNTITDFQGDVTPGGEVIPINNDGVTFTPIKIDRWLSLDFDSWMFERIQGKPKEYTELMEDQFNNVVCELKKLVEQSKPISFACGVILEKIPVSRKHQIEHTHNAVFLYGLLEGVKK